MTRFPPRRRQPDRARAPRRAAAASLTVLAAACALIFGPAVFGAAPAAFAAVQPNALTISGAGLRAPLTIRADTDKDLFDSLLRQVSWMATRTGDFPEIDTKTLGPKYTVTVYGGGKALQTYDLYPLASGGPRGYRPADQPAKKSAEAWFYASVSLPDALVAAGVPLPDPVSSGQADGVGYAEPGATRKVALPSTPPFDLDNELAQARMAVLATALTGMAVLVMLFAAATHSRRYGR